MTGRRYVPSTLLLVPGPWRHADEAIEALSRAGIPAVVGGQAPFEAGSITVELVDDDGVGAAVSGSLGGDPSAELVELLESSHRAALVEIAGRLSADVARTARVGRALRDAGGLAVRMERSGVAFEWAAWLDLLETEPPGLLSLGVIMFRDAESLFTCGMHHFDLPDIELVGGGDEAVAAGWLDAFAGYLLFEDPALTSGHTFRPDEDSPRRVLERWPDHRHAQGDGRHNPFGIWRVLPPGERGLEPFGLALVPIPSLVSVLLAAERNLGRPLSKAEVERAADEAASTAMAIADAAALEQSRGYADIDPRLAWEQWKVVRRGL